MLAYTSERASVLLPFSPAACGSVSRGAAYSTALQRADLTCSPRVRICTNALAAYRHWLYSQNQRKLCWELVQFIKTEPKCLTTALSHRRTVPKCVLSNSPSEAPAESYDALKGRPTAHQDSPSQTLLLLRSVGLLVACISQSGEGGHSL